MKIRFLHSTFFNIVCRSIKLLAVVLRSILEGSVLVVFLCCLEKMLSFFSTIFYVSHHKKKTKA